MSLSGVVYMQFTCIININNYRYFHNNNLAGMREIKLSGLFEIKIQINFKIFIEFNLIANYIYK